MAAVNMAGALRNKGTKSRRKSRNQGFAQKSRPFFSAQAAKTCAETSWPHAARRRLFGEGEKN
jgi:hypothetical protein